METAEQPALSPEERARYAERRHLFWRSRCLEHASTIHRLEAHIHHLREVIATLEKRHERPRTA